MSLTPWLPGCLSCYRGRTTPSQPAGLLISGSLMRLSLLTSLLLVFTPPPPPPPPVSPPGLSPPSCLETTWRCPRALCSQGGGEVMRAVLWWETLAEAESTETPLVRAAVVGSQPASQHTQHLSTVVSGLVRYQSQSGTFY